MKYKYVGKKMRLTVDDECKIFYPGEIYDVKEKNIPKNFKKVNK